MLFSSLHWADFETLVDALFSRTGWQRLSRVAEYKRTSISSLSSRRRGSRAFVNRSDHGPGRPSLTPISLISPVAHGITCSSSATRHKAACDRASAAMSMSGPERPWPQRRCAPASTTGSSRRRPSRRLQTAASACELPFPADGRFHVRWDIVLHLLVDPLSLLNALMSRVICRSGGSCA